MSVESWMGIAVGAVLLVCLAVLCAAAVRCVRVEMERRAFAAEPPPVDDLKTPFARGWRMGLDHGVKVGVEAMKPVVDLAEARRVMLQGCREMGVKVRAELVAGELDGARLAVKLGEERLLIRHRGRVLAYDWAARTCGGGKRWEYAFAGEIEQETQPKREGTI